MKTNQSPEVLSGPCIAIADYDMGNRGSVRNALQAVGATPIITRDPGDLGKAAGIILPGVGAFPAAIEKIRRYRLDKELEKARSAGKPILGICLGHQLLFEASEEHEYAKGLGFISGVARKISPQGPMNVGWCPVSFTRSNGLNAGLPDKSNFYHLHSYAVMPEDESVVFARSLAYRVDGEDGELVDVVSGVRSNNLYGVQFHPEKSSDAGLRLLKNFVELSANTQAGI